MSTITHLKELSVPERLQLVEDLWDSIASDQMALPDYPKVVEEVRLRRTRFETNPTPAISWEQLKGKIRADRG
jgi:putative addiction module component (TIGR02574 family)